MKFSIRDEPPAWPPGPKPVEHQGRKPFGRGIDGRGNAGRSGADDGEVDLLRGTVSPNAGAAGQLLQRRIHQNLAVAAFDDRRLLGRAERFEDRLALRRFPDRTR